MSETAPTHKARRATEVLGQADRAHTPTSPTARVAGQHARSTHRLYKRRSVFVVLGASAVALAAGLALSFGWATVAIEALLIAAITGVDRYATPIIARWGRGAEAEEHVGTILDAMRDQGWLAIHDVSLGRGNVDHIAIGPAGIFTIETKSHPGRINAKRIDGSMVKQAYAEAKLIERITGFDVQPLLVFSRAYLTPAVCRRQGVVILPARLLAGHLGRREAKLSPQEAKALHARFLAALSG